MNIAVRSDLERLIDRAQAGMPRFWGSCWKDIATIFPSEKGGGSEWHLNHP